VDVEGFTAGLEQQRQRSKDSREAVDLTADGALGVLASQLGAPTSFLGYDQLQAQSKVAALLVNGQQVDQAVEGDEVEVVLDSTPFYAESGGQVGDTGLLAAVDDDTTVLQVSDVQKAAAGQLFVHRATVQGGSLRIGQAVTAQVDQQLRRRIRAHHTATHLLQSALKTVLGPDTCQQGSLVNGQRLR
jgi:alanyl-tRNA synthetase